MQWNIDISINLFLFLAVKNYFKMYTTFVMKHQTFFLKLFSN